MITRKRNHLSVAVATLVALGISLTAATGTSAATTPAATTKAPIVLLQTVPIDSSVLSFPNFRTGSAVAVAAVNGAGGINGRPLRINYCDDKQNATLAAQCVTQGAAAGAVARVSSIGGQGAVISPLLQNSKMADFGSVSGRRPEFTGANEYPLSLGSFALLAYGNLMKKKFPSAKTAVVLIVDAAGRQGRQDLLVKGAQAAGIQVLDQIVIPAATADLSGIAGQVARAKPDIILSAVSVSQLIKWWSASQSIGLQTPLIQTASGATPDVLSQAGPAAAWTFFADFYPDYASNVPARRRSARRWAKYAPGQPLTRDAWIAWVGVTAFAAIIKSMRGNITPSTVWGTISRVKCFNVLYFSCLNFTKPGPITEAPALRVTNTFLLAVKNGTLVGTPISATLT